MSTSERKSGGRIYPNTALIGPLSIFDIPGIPYTDEEGADHSLTIYDYFDALGGNRKVTLSKDGEWGIAMLEFEPNGVDYAAAVQLGVAAGLADGGMDFSLSDGVFFIVSHSGMLECIAENPHWSAT